MQCLTLAILLLLDWAGKLGANTVAYFIVSVSNEERKVLFDCHHDCPYADGGVLGVGLSEAGGHEQVGGVVEHLKIYL
jgi:hypothetical protein